MNWDDLTHEEKVLYRWFRRECPCWVGGECRALMRQRQHLRLDLPEYIPEAIYGEPHSPAGGRKDIFFVGINPGLGGLHDAGCWHVGEDPDDATYANRHLHWYDHEAEPGVDKIEAGWYEDSVTGAALGILLAAGDRRDLLGNNVHVVPNHPGFAHACEQGYLGSVVALNASHCKTPPRTGMPSAAELDNCGRKSFELVTLFRPRAVVCFGWPWTNWIYRAARGVPGRHIHPWTNDEWTINFDPQSMPRLDGSIVHFRHEEDGDVIAFIKASHPTSGGYRGGFGAVVDSLRAELDGQ